MPTGKTGDPINIPGVIVVDSIEHLSTITEAKEPIRPKGSYYDDIKKCFNEIFPDYDPPRYIPPKYPSLSLLHWNSVPVYKMPFLKLLTEMSKTKTKETEMKYDFIEQNSTTMMMCPHGSVYWALAMLKQERRVRPLSAEYYYMYDDNMEYPIRKIEIATGASAEGYKKPRFLHAYQGIKFEIYEEPKFKVGDWVKNKNTGKYCQIVGVNSGSKYAMQVREAGSNTAIMAAVEDYEPASLNPDFSKAKVGDEVFRMADGYKKITVIESDVIPIYIYAENSWFDVRGFPCSLHKHEHPTLFHSHHQARAYFLEMFRKLDEEQR